MSEIPLYGPTRRSNVASCNGPACLEPHTQGGSMRVMQLRCKEENLDSHTSAERHASPLCICHLKHHTLLAEAGLGAPAVPPV